MAKEKEVTVINTGVCAIYINRVRLLPDEEMTVSAELLSGGRFDYLIYKGDLAVKDNSSLTGEAKERVASKRKKDPNEGKTKAQLEDGGEI